MKDGFSLQDIARIWIGTKSQTIKSLTHEINNPLTVVLGRTNQLKRMISSDEMDTPKALEVLNLIESQSIKISRQLNILSHFFSDLESEPLAPFTLEAIRDEVEEYFSEKVSRYGTNWNFQVSGSLNDIVPSSQKVLFITFQLISSAFEAAKNEADGFVEADLQWANGPLEMTLRYSDSRDKTRSDGGVRFGGEHLGLDVLEDMITEMGGQFRWERKSGSAESFYKLPSLD